MRDYRRVFLNGRFLTQRLTGVQRYASEMTRTLDSLLAEGSVPQQLAAAEWTLMVPAGQRSNLSLSAISTRELGRDGAHPQKWEQLDLAFAARRGLLINFANSGPIVHRRQLVVLHDAAVFRHPEFYRRAYRSYHRTMHKMLSSSATICTVSEFSRKELSHFLGILSESIQILPNGSEHLSSIEPDRSILDELGLRHRPFFLAIGSLTGNKNVGLAVEAMSRLERFGAALVVVGDGNNAVFSRIADHHCGGMVQAGRLPDERVAALYEKAVALIFPSLYEGFGIPPLEAMAYGCAVLASTAEAIRATCGDAASYFSPDDPAALAALMAARLVAGRPSREERERSRARAAFFTWRISAERLLRVLTLI